MSNTLDEPTFALDKDTVESLKQILISIKNDKIIILITHEDDMVDIADETIKFNEYMREL